MKLLLALSLVGRQLAYPEGMETMSQDCRIVSSASRQLSIPNNDRVSMMTSDECAV